MLYKFIFSRNKKISPQKEAITRNWLTRQLPALFAKLFLFFILLNASVSTKEKPNDMQNRQQETAVCTPQPSRPQKSNCATHQEKPFWQDLQNEWKIWPYTKAPQLKEVKKNFSSLQPKFILSALKEKSSENLGVKWVVTKFDISDIPKEQKNYGIYIRTSMDIDIYLNDHKLEEKRLSEFEHYFPISSFTNEKDNIIALALKTNRNKNIKSSIFLTNLRGLERLRTSVINIDTNNFKRNKSISLEGPFFMRSLSDGAYLELKKNPNKFNINNQDYWKVLFFDDRRLMKLIYPNKEFPLRMVYTFSFKFKFKPSQALVLNLAKIDGSDETWLNGKLLARTGKPDDKTKTYYDKIRKYIISESLVRIDKPNRVVIVAHSSPGGNIAQSFWSRGLRLSEIQKEISLNSVDEAISLFLIGIYIAVGFYFLLMYIRRPKSYDNLFFALFTLSVAAWLFFLEQVKYLAFEDFYTLKKIEYLCVQLAYFSFPCFIYFYFKKRNSIIEKLAIVVLVTYLTIVMIATGQIIFTEEFWLWDSAISLQRQLVLLIIGFSSFMLMRDILYYFYRIIYKAAPKIFTYIKKIDSLQNRLRNNHNQRCKKLPKFLHLLFESKPPTLEENTMEADVDAVIMILGFVALAVAAVHDAASYGTATSAWTKYGLAGFLLSFAGVLANRFVRLHKEVEDKNIQLTKLDVLKDNFLSNISHELNSPIASLVMNAEMLKAGDYGEDDLLESYTQLEIDAYQLKHLVHKMMLISKIESKEIIIAQRQEKLIKIISHAISQLEESFAGCRKNISLSINSDIEIYSDPALLQAILTELIKNALQYGLRENKKITIKSNTSNSHISILIEDEGDGVPEEFIPRLKEKFFRLDNSLTYVESGTGLGLFLSDRIATLLDGKLMFSNRKSGGFCSKIILPKN